MYCILQRCLITISSNILFLTIIVESFRLGLLDAFTDYFLEFAVDNRSFNELDLSLLLH